MHVVPEQEDNLSRPLESLLAATPACNLSDPLPPSLQAKAAELLRKLRSDLDADKAAGSPLSLRQQYGGKRGVRR